MKRQRRFDQIDMLIVVKRRRMDDGCHRTHLEQRERELDAFAVNFHRQNILRWLVIEESDTQTEG